MKTGGHSGAVRVLVIDEDPGMRASLAGQLRRNSGFECAGAYADAESAWAAMLKTPPELVVMGVGLPGMDGIACTRQIKCTVSGDNLFATDGRGATF